MNRPTQLTMPRLWHVTEVLGHGATSTVVRVRAADGLSLVAKVSRDADSDSVLLGEARALALAASPHTAQLVDVVRASLHEGELASSEDGRVALLLVDRPSHAIDVTGSAELLSLAVGLTDALATLHAAGLAHGDVKPENLRRLVDGGVELLDLGLARDVRDRHVAGGTPRYLALGDRDLGDGEARDVLAAGLVLAELERPSLCASQELVREVRELDGPAPLRELILAATAPVPALRPTAAWVAARARAMQGVDATPMRGASRSRVRAAYAHLRRAALDGSAAPDDAPEVLLELVRWGNAIAALEGRPCHGTLSPLGELARARLLVELVGPSAAHWPLDRIGAVSERTFVDVLLALADTRAPEGWTLAELEARLALADDSSASGEGSRDNSDQRSDNDNATTLATRARPPSPSSQDPAVAAALAAQLERTPVDTSAIHAVENDVAAPRPLVLRAADVLRLAGEGGRAAVLLARLDDGDPAALAGRAEITRRVGRPEEAIAMATRALELADADDGTIARATATCARAHLDLGDAARALELASSVAAAATFEVAALASASLGDMAAALACLDRADRLGATAEERARLAGARGYALASTHPEGAYAAFSIAAEHAARAGAVVEEATYLTGAAAAAVDLGSLDAAVRHATRATLLWEHVHAPAKAARALLASTAAHAVAAQSAPTREGAAVVRELAMRGGDARAEAYAELAVADVAAPRAAMGIEATTRALALLHGDPTDALLVGARALRHGLAANDLVTRGDALATATSASIGARLDWWGARAAVLASEGPDVATTDDGESSSQRRAGIVVSSLVALVDVRAPVGARGPAFQAGAQLAAQLGHGEAALRLRAASREAARVLCERCGPTFSAAVRALPWVVVEGLESSGGSGAAAKLGELERQVRALGGTAKLGDLLRQVLDALVTWTGVERGLLLLLAPDGRLVPRAARNLARRDLTSDQLALSQSIARRALAALEPVVAVDAAGELLALSESVHALKLRSVLAVPLIARGVPLGVVYLDDRVRRGAFGEAELTWVRTLAQLAAALVASALASAQLARSHRRTRRAERELEHALADRTLALDVAKTELSRLTATRDRSGPFASIVGTSEILTRTVRTSTRIAHSDVPVLIVGESGSGKELFARAIHGESKRSAAAFVSENCGAIPESLLESALFGHVRGAFTGADRSRVGLFEAADKGTLFLDEVGEMSLAMQAKLLRVLEDGEVRPLGTERSKHVEVRLIAATHRDLSQMVAARTFREDLFYRLAIMTVPLPALRERSEDIPLLARQFVARHSHRGEVAITSLAMQRLVAFSWPGNVRQLENEIRRALVLSDGPIDAEHLSPAIGESKRPAMASGLDMKARLDDLSSELVREALTRTHGNQTQAAKLLGLSRFGLQKMMKRLSLTPRGAREHDA